MGTGAIMRQRPEVILHRNIHIVVWKWHRGLEKLVAMCPLVLDPMVKSVGIRLVTRPILCIVLGYSAM